MFFQKTNEKIRLNHNVAIGRIVFVRFLEEFEDTIGPFAFDAEFTENFLNGLNFYAIKLKLPALAVGGRPSRIRASLLFVFRSSYVA